MKRVVSQINLDEMAMDESAMELELIKLQANYRHLSDYYDSYKEETQRLLKKQNDNICALLSERDLLERILGNYSSTEKVIKERNKQDLLQLLSSMKECRQEMMDELELLRKDNEQLEEVEEKILAKRISMGGIYGPLEYRLHLYRRKAKLENRQNRMSMAFNNTLAVNKQLRGKINHIRVERAVFERLHKKIARELEQCKHQKAHILLSASVALEQRQEALTKIQVHKERDEKEQVVFDQSMKVLERLMCHEKQMNTFMAIKCNDRQDFKAEEAERREKEVRDTLDTDLRSLNQYKESFDCIKEVAELDDVDAIIARFLSQEAENFALFNYVTELNGEIEILQEEVNAITQDIDKLQTEQQQATQHSEEQLAELMEKESEVTLAVERLEKQLADINTILDELKTLIFDAFQRIGCSTHALEEMLGLNVEITTKNMIVYLGQIEQRANELLNILHYVNLKKSQLTGMLPARVDIASFIPKTLPELQLQLPALPEKDADADVADVHPMSRQELEDAAIENITQRNKELSDQVPRSSGAAAGVSATHKISS